MLREVRRSGSGQGVSDDQILERLRENEGSGTPTQINKNGVLIFSGSHVSCHRKKLAGHDFVQHVGDNAYLITDEGEGYFDDDYDAENEVWLNQEPHERFRLRSEWSNSRRGRERR